MRYMFNTNQPPCSDNRNISTKFFVTKFSSVSRYLLPFRLKHSSHGLFSVTFSLLTLSMLNNYEITKFRKLALASVFRQRRGSVVALSLYNHHLWACQLYRGFPSPKPYIYIYIHIYIYIYTHTHA
jgi:hypothetical protein